MKRVLAVDDSRSMRMLITEALAPLGIEILQAEDGQKGLQAAIESTPDLILLDVTMPVMDGPAMFKEMRCRGLKTPVILLTASLNAATVAPLIALGLNDYIAKPFNTSELQAKVKKILFRGEESKAVQSPQPPAIVASDKPEPSTETTDVASPDVASPSMIRAHVDILIIDDMPNVAKRFKNLIPDSIQADDAVDIRTATELCRSRLYRVVLIDVDMPGINASSLVRLLRVLQPTAIFVAIVLKNVKDPQQVAKEIGLRNVFLKPFDAEQVKDLLATYFETGPLVECKDNLVQIAACASSKGKEERYFSDVVKSVNESIDSVAAACFPSVIVDLSSVPRAPAAIVQMITKILGYAKSFDLELQLITPTDVKDILMGFVETTQIPMFPTAADADAGSNQFQTRK
jgi:DNA-binding response OmpR family regulator